MKDEEPCQKAGIILCEYAYVNKKFIQFSPKYDIIKALYV